jgi:toxin ParE1/3/4
MKVIWTESAADNLTAIVEFINLDDPTAARRVAQVIFDKVMSLADTPYRGRKRYTDEYRELIFAPWPYVAVYGIDGDKVYLHHVRHTAQLLP